MGPPLVLAIPMGILLSLFSSSLVSFVIVVIMITILIADQIVLWLHCAWRSLRQASSLWYALKQI
jgi:hypothetical protein